MAQARGLLRLGSIRRMMLLVVAAAFGVLVWSPSVATAGVTHPFLYAFTGAELPETTFAGPAGIAIDQATHALYVLDAQGGSDRQGALDVMTESGHLIRQVTDSEVLGSFEHPHAFAVDNSASSNGRTYIATTQGVGVFDASGKFVREITGAEVPGGNGLHANGIAVDSAGNVYVSNSRTGRIDKFDSSGHFITEIGQLAGEYAAIALNGEGDIYAIVGIVEGTPHVIELSPGGEKLLTLESNAEAEEQSQIAVDPTTGDVYISHRTFVNEYDGSGALISRYGPPDIGVAAGVAVDSELDHSFVADSAHLEVSVYGPSAPAPDAKTGACTATDQTEATFEGSVNPASETLPATYQFEYGTTTEYGSTAPAMPQSVGTGSSAEPVAATGSGLEPNVTYHYRLLAFNANGRTEGQDRTCVTPGLPAIKGISVSGVTSVTADLNAEISADGSDTYYVFEYGLTSGYELGTVPVAPGQGIGSAHEVERVAQELTGLQPGGTYHFRVTATSAQGVVHSPDATLTTFPAASGLPDDRAYELVSPPNKEDGEVYSTGNWAVPGNQSALPQPFQSAPSGSAVSYTGDASRAGNGISGNEYLARRTGAGWQSVDLSPPTPGPNSGCPLGGAVTKAPVSMFSEDLAKSVLLITPNPSLAALTGAPSCFSSLFLRNDESNSYQATLTTAPPNRPPPEFGFGTEGATQVDASRMFAGSSSDLSKVFFAANDALVSPASDGGPNANNLYEAEPGHPLRLVNIGENGTTEPNATFGSPPIGGESPPNITRAISRDGRRAFWTDLNSPTKLLMRENGERTVQLDKPQGGSGEGGGGKYWTASSDGSRVFFTDGSFAGLTADTVQFSLTNLYMYDTNTGKLSDLTGGDEAPNVMGVVGASEDGSYVYFVATGDLASGASGEEPHLYLWHEGITTYIATLSETDNNFTHIFPNTTQKGEVGDWAGSTALTSARVTPDGRHLVFMALEPLTGAPTGGQSEVYLYDADSKALSCVSCLATGVPPTEPSVLLVSQTNGFQPRWVTDDGSRVFFESKEALVAGDKNKTWDVYEYEGGTVHLISGGASPNGSYFDDATPTGSDVFFTTREALVRSDTDEQADLYDARIGGGFPFEPPSVPCSGGACRGTQTAPPLLEAAASTAVGASGNLAPPASASSTGAPVSPVVSRAKKLMAALRACKRKAKGKRAACVRQAERRYGARPSRKAAHR